MLTFLKAALVVAVLSHAGESFSVSLDQAEQMMNRAGVRLLETIERRYREGALTRLEKEILVADTNAFLVAYRDYSLTASRTHLYLKSRAERENHYVNKITHISDRLRNLGERTSGSIEDLTEELSDFVPIERRCGRPPVNSCVLREIESQTNMIHANIGRWSSRYREKFRILAEKGLHAAELYARVVGSFRALERRSYATEYLLTKDRTVSAVREEIEIGY